MLPKKPTLIARLFHAIARALRSSRDLRMLEMMSDRELRDLGIGRSQIQGLLRQVPRDGIRTKW